jgi:galactose-1-phosphate uridylyltransferase
MNDETYIPIPNTVGEMIDFLKKFPKDYQLDLYYKHNCYGVDEETSAYNMKFHELTDYGSLELTVK